MREISKKQKLHVATIIIVCSLIIYDIGIATNLFVSPVFSMFWIISDQTAHNVAYVAVVIAIALTTVTLTINLIKKTKTARPETNNKPVIHTIKASNEAPVTVKSTTQIPTQPNTDKNATTNQEAVIENEDKISCPACKKEFSRPRFVLNYGSSETKLTRFCPYCNQSLDPEQKNTAEEDLWKKYFKT